MERISLESPTIINNFPFPTEPDCVSQCSQQSDTM